MKIAGTIRCMLLAALLGHAAPGVAQVPPPGSNLQVFLITIGPGADIYERFGHNAIWVRDTVAMRDLIYNYGTFSFPQSLAGSLNFAGQFIMGRPRYWLGVETSLQRALDEYAERKRDVDAQELNFSAAQKADLATRLAINALPANKYYGYDYFRDNCSTRVRDMLDAVLGGAMRRATAGHPADGTLRFHTRRSITNGKLLYVGIDAAFGPNTDRSLDRWNEMFLPEKVQQLMRELTVTATDGTVQPMVLNTLRLLELRAFRVESEPPTWFGRFALVSLALSAVILLATARGPVRFVGRLTGSGWLLLMGLLGALLLFFWLFTGQVATYANRNLLLMSPLALGAVRMVWQRGATVAPWRWWLLAAVALSATTGALVSFLPIFGYQDMSTTVSLTLLPTLSALIIAARRQAEDGRPAH